MNKILEILNCFSAACVTLSLFLLFVSTATLVYLKLGTNVTPFAQILWIIIWIVASFRIGFALQGERK